MGKIGKRIVAVFLTMLMLIGTTPLNGLTAHAQCTHTLQNIGVETDATCTSPGVMKVRCKICSYWGDQTIPPKGHDYHSFTIQPTSTQAGSRGEKCSRCGATRNVTSIPATGTAIEVPELSFSNVTSSSITISWPKTNATYYNLYGSSSESGASFNLLTTLGGQSTYSFTHSGLTANTTYHYRIAAVNASSGNSAYSKVYDKATSAKAAQNTHVPLGSFDQARSGNGTVTVAGWAFDDDQPTAPVDIHVYVGGPAGAAGAEGHAIGLANGSRSDVGAAYPGRGNNHGFSKTFTTNKRGQQDVYVYAINIDSSGKTGGSNTLLGKRTVTVAPATTALEAPELSFSAVTASTITISWPKTNATYYNLYGSSSESGASYNLLTTLGGQSTYSFTHSGLTANTTYHYRIEAVDAGSGNSVYSKVCNKTTNPQTMESNLPELSFSDVTTTSITISWPNSNRGNCYYNLYGSASAGKINDQLLYTMGGRSSYSFTHSGLRSNTTYYYRIEAVDLGSRTSEYSELYTQKTRSVEEYTITYDANGGAGAPDRQIKTQYVGMELSSTVPTRDGYNFCGWATRSNASSAVYHPGDIYAADAPATLFAVWDEIAFDTSDTVAEYCENEALKDDCTYAYYQSGRMYSSKSVSVNQNVEGIHTFRILSAAEVTITLKASKNASFFVNLYTYPSREASANQLDLNTAARRQVLIRNTSLTSDGAYKYWTYTFSTAPRYTGSFDDFYDFAFFVTSNQSKALTYSCDFSYSYPADITATNGGYWKSSSLYRYEALSEAAAEVKTGTWVPYYIYNVSKYEDGVNPMEAAVSDYWFLTKTQKEQWQNICHYIYGDMIDSYKKEAWVDFGIGMVTLFKDKLLSNNVNPEEILLADFYPEDSPDGDKVWMILTEYLKKGSEEFRKELISKISDNLDGVAVDTCIEACECILDSLAIYINEPMKITEEIEKDIYQASIDGTLPQVLTRISDAIDDGTIRSLYLDRVLNEKMTKKLVDSFKNAAADVLKDAAKETAEGVVIFFCPGSKVFFDWIYPVFQQVSGVINVYVWCDTMELFLSEVNAACALYNNIQTNCLTATFLHKKLAPGAFEQLRLEIKNMNCRAWNGQTIPQTMHYDTIGTVKAY